MSSTNGTTQFEALHHTLDEQVDAFKAGVKKLVDKATTKSNGEPSWLSSFVGKTGETIKAHPLAAVGIALGFGYLVVRLARR